MFKRFEDVCILDGVRTTVGGCQGAGTDARTVDSAITGSMAPGGFDPSHVTRPIDEALGARTLPVAHELGLDEDKLDVKGGAIALLTEDTQA